MKIKFSRIFLLLAAILHFVTQQAKAEEINKHDWLDSLKITAGTILTTRDTPPFWLHANQDGRISTSEGSSIFTRLRLSKQAETNKLFDWTYGIDVTARTGSESNIIWTDAYAGIKYRNLKLTIGRKSEFFGLADTLLTAGPELYSRNAPTIPKIALSTNGYIPIAEDFAINAYLAHGWMGEEQNAKDAYLHQKFIYLRYGTANPYKGINIYAGLHHVVVWGGTDRTNGFHYPSDLGNYAKIFFGSAGGSDAAEVDQTNALGNHIGSIEYALKFKGCERDWFLYAQTLFEDSSGLVGAGLIKPGDYLIGLSLINKHPAATIKRINVEYLDTAGESLNSDGTGSYFYHYQYGSGWTYNGYGIGHPFISFVPGPDYRWYPQNRLTGANAGIALAFNDIFNPIIRIAWIQQKGTLYEPIPAKDKFALALANTTYLSKNWKIDQSIFFDAGKDIKPNPAMLLSITRSLY